MANINIYGKLVNATPEGVLADSEQIKDTVQNKKQSVINSEVKSELSSKQDLLVSGTNIKTVNGESLLGEGDITIETGSSEVTWDNVTGKPSFATVATSGDYNDLTDTPDLTVYQPITDNSLATSAKTIPTAINEIKESVDSISDPYEINLTNLLSAENSESISTAIGGIDNLNATVQDNRIIVGTISNGSVSVSIRILGNVTTLYYLLDSVVGLTLNEIAITNTSGILSKRVTTHAVLTENMVINSLDSDETTLPLSAAQGKALKEDVKTTYQKITDESLQTTNKTVTGAINEVNQAVKTKQDKLKPGTGVEITSDNTVNVTLDTTVFKVVASLPESPAAGDENKIHLVPAESTEEGNIYTEYVFVNGKWEEFGTYRSDVDLTTYLKKEDAEATYQKITDNTLATTAKTIVGAINEVKSSADTNTGNVTRIDRAVGNPVIEEIDLSEPDEVGYYWHINGQKVTNANYSIKYVNLSKGDLLIVNITSSSIVAQLTVVDSTHTKVVQTIDSNGEGGTYVKSSFLADRDCIVAISRYGTTVIGETYAYIVKSPFNTAISDNSYMQYLHKVYEEYGAVYNDDTGYWELNGLTDLTEEDMWKIYLAGVPKTNDLTEFYAESSSANKSIRTTFNYFVKGRGTGIGTILRGTFIQCANLEVVQFYKNKGQIITVNELIVAFYNCQKLREINDILTVYSSTLSTNNMFENCKALESVKLGSLRTDISFKDSPLLSYESIKYLVDNAANTAAITVTVHPTTYSYLTGTAQPTTEVGGTTEEWQALVTAAQAKQISFAVPEETQSEVTE